MNGDVPDKIEIKGIYPHNNPDKMKYLETITTIIGYRIISEFPPAYIEGFTAPEKITISWATRKNASPGVCRRLWRIIIYNELKIKDWDYSKLIALAVHECSHLVYDGHKKDFMNFQEKIFDECLVDLEKGF